MIQESRVKNLHLIKNQFLDLLKRARARLDKIDKAEGYDCTDTGAKSTDTNVGLCDESLTTKEIAMFPESFSGRKSMKYRKER